MHPKGEKDFKETYRMKIVKLNLFRESQTTFDATCETLRTFKLSQHSIRHREHSKVSSSTKINHEPVWSI